MGSYMNIRRKYLLIGDERYNIHKIHVKIILINNK